jgi:hypothetical protein
MATLLSWILIFTGDLMAPLDIRVYRKPILTNLYLSANSHHHPVNKLAALSTLAHRAKAICDSESLPHKLKFLHNIWDDGCSKKRQILGALNPPKRAPPPPRRQDPTSVASIGYYPNTISRQWASCQESSHFLWPIRDNLAPKTACMYSIPSLSAQPASPPSLATYQHRQSENIAVSNFAAVK